MTDESDWSISKPLPEYIKFDTNYSSPNFGFFINSTDLTLNDTYLDIKLKVTIYDPNDDNSIEMQDESRRWRI